MDRKMGKNERIMEVAGTRIKKLGSKTDLANMEKPELPGRVEITSSYYNHMSSTLKKKRVWPWPSSVG